MTSLADTIAATLAEHELQYGPRIGQTCSCGHANSLTGIETQQDGHRAHVATVLAEQEARRREAQLACHGKPPTHHTEGA